MDYNSTFKTSSLSTAHGAWKRREKQWLGWGQVWALTGLPQQLPTCAAPLPGLSWLTGLGLPAWERAGGIVKKWDFEQRKHVWLRQRGKYRRIVWISHFKHLELEVVLKDCSKSQSWTVSCETL